MKLLIGLLFTSLLIPPNLVAQSTQSGIDSLLFDEKAIREVLFGGQSAQSEVDSVSFEQFKVEMGQFLERAVDLHLEAAMHMSVQKLAYNNFLKGKRKDLPDIYEGGGEKVLLDSYSYIRQGTALLHALEHLEMGKESKNKYRVLLSKSINDVSKRILALVEVQESTDEVKREARRRVMRKLGLDYRK